MLSSKVVIYLLVLIAIVGFIYLLVSQTSGYNLPVYKKSKPLPAQEKTVNPPKKSSVKK